VMRFNARGAAGLLDGKSPGQPSKLNDVQRRAIVRMGAAFRSVRPQVRTLKYHPPLSRNHWKTGRWRAAGYCACGAQSVARRSISSFHHEGGSRTDFARSR
jgi:hypothetical protein